MSGIVKETSAGSNFLEKISTGADASSANAVQLYEKYNGSDGSSSNTVFTLAGQYVTGSNTLLVFVNGQKAELNASGTTALEYEETSSVQVTLKASILDTDTIEFMVIGSYQMDLTDIENSLPTIYHKNAIINGNFDIWQRGTSFTSASSGIFTADRYDYAKSGTMIHDISQDTDVPSDVNANYSLKLECTTVDSSIGSTDLTLIRQKIEGYNFLPFIGNTFTLSFWVKATQTGTYCVSFRNSTNARSYISEYTINTTDTWEKKEITVVHDSTGTWEQTNDIGCYVDWVIAAGSNYQTSNNETWEGSNYLCTTNQVNGCGTISNEFYLSNIQLEFGDRATDFEYRNIQDEIALCQRYYEKSYEIGTNPGTSTSNGLKNITTTSLNSATFTAYLRVDFLKRKRIAPTVVWYAPDGTINTIDVGGSNVSPTTTDACDNGILVSGVGISSSSRIIRAHYTADAEL